MRKVSIIIPVYHVEAYVERCLLSALNQTYGNLEIVLVDDCGQDDSMGVADRVVSGHRNGGIVRVLRHLRNRGLSAARNTGLDAVSGDYVYFLDSDDELFDDTAIAGLVEVCDPYDVVVGGVVTGDGRDYLRNKDLTLTGNRAVMEAYFKGEIYPMAWNKLVRREFLLDNRLYFKEGLIHEDSLWTFQFVSCAKSVRVVDSPSYIYHIRENTLSTNYTLRNVEYLLSIYSFMQKRIRDHYSSNLLAGGFLLDFIFWQAVMAIKVCRCSYADYRRLIQFDRSLICRFSKLDKRKKVKYLFFLLPAGLQYLSLKYYLALSDCSKRRNAIT
jgi:glycosyltransferase involved in cell wall biosynthesis